MSLSSKSEVIDYFESVWAKRSEHDIGLAIIEYLASHIDARTLPMTVFLDAAKFFIKKDEDKQTVFSIINYLAGSDLNLLIIEIELIEDDEIYYLEPDQAFAATNYLINPTTGIVDPDIKSKLFVCFTPSELARKVLRS